MKNEKHEKNDKTMKKLEENCNFPFFGKFLHHWKKWWNMIKKMIKNDKKMKNEMIKIWLKNDKKWYLKC